MLILLDKLILRHNQPKRLQFLWDGRRLYQWAKT